ncbi:MAG: DUF2092 domain-containing protein [Acidobacteriota bacterium]
MKNMGIAAALLVSCLILACCGAVDSTPEGKRRLREMSDLLAASTTLRVETSEIHEWTGDSGVGRIEGKRKAAIWKPNALWESVRGSGSREIDYELYYDGLNLSIDNHSNKVWAQAEVPPTLDGMLDEMAWRFDLFLPVADFFYSSPYDAVMTDATECRFVGTETIEGHLCDRFAFTQDVVDWEIWIRSEGEPLPCRLDISHKQREGEKPPYSRILFTGFDRNIELDEGIFDFTPPGDYTRIPVVENPKPENTEQDAGSEKPEDAAGKGGNH